MKSDIKTQLEEVAEILRRDVLEMTSEAGSGHMSSALSCAEIMSTLFFNEMLYDPKNPENDENDEFILSKGHAAPILYSALYRAGCINQDLMNLRKLSSPLEGHPIPSSLLPWVKVATGSLGQGLSIALGYSLAAKLNKKSARTYVLIGDSESSEGSIYEALQLAPYYNLNNLTLIMDVNRLGQTGQTILGNDVKSYALRFNDFGWETISVNGHNIPQLISAFEKARKSQRPSVIIAKTIKGKGVKFIEDKNNWHGKVLSKRELEKVKFKKELRMPQIQFRRSIMSEFNNKKNIKEKNNKVPQLTKYKRSDLIATRQAYGNALVALAKIDPNILAVDAEVSNSTYSEEVKKIKPKQFVEAYIAEQNMIGMSLGLSKKGFNVFASTFSAFLTRAHDQLRMSALSNANFSVCGSHSGVSIGEDGASQMGLEDIAMFRSIPKSIILYPSDAISTEKLVHLAANTKGLKYIRTTRPKTPIIYSNEDKFNLGDFKILRQSPGAKVVLIGSGITLHESLKAHEILNKNKKVTVVIDLYSIKPLDIKKLILFIKQHGNKIVISEDHYKEGGIGELISSELALGNTNTEIKHLYISEIPHSGKVEELLEKYRINAKSIAEAASSLI